jgi:hypothetical protein
VRPAIIAAHDGMIERAIKVLNLGGSEMFGTLGSTRYHGAVEFAKLDTLGKLENAVNSVQLQEMRRAASRRRRNSIAEKQAPGVLSNEIAGAMV